MLLIFNARAALDANLNGHCEADIRAHKAVKKLNKLLLGDCKVCNFKKSVNQHIQH